MDRGRGPGGSARESANAARRAGAAGHPPAPPAANAAAFAALPLGELARRTAVVLAVAVAFAAGVWLFLEVREIVLWLVIAVVLAMALEPAVAWLTRHRFRRGPAAVLVSLAAIVVLAGIVAVLAVPLVNQARQLVDDLPTYVNDLTKPGSPFASLESRFHIVEHLRALARAGSPCSPARARRGCRRCARPSRCSPRSSRSSR